MIIRKDNTAFAYLCTYRSIILSICSIVPSTVDRVKCLVAEIFIHGLNVRFKIFLMTEDPEYCLALIIFAG